MGLFQRKVVRTGEYRAPQGLQCHNAKALYTYLKQRVGGTNLCQVRGGHCNNTKGGVPFSEGSW